MNIQKRNILIAVVFVTLPIILLANCTKKNKITTPPTPPVVKSDTTKNFATISGSVSNLNFNKIGENAYFVHITTSDAHTTYEQYNPIIVELVNADNSTTWIANKYSSLTQQGDDVLCTATITTPGNAKLEFKDTYKKLTNDGTFQVQRHVKVMQTGSEKGFATRIGFERSISESISNYDFFVPSVWYKQNSYVPANALASSMYDEFYWFREDRLPLPLFMAREIASGNTFSVYHKDADGSTFTGEDGLNRIIDGRMKFASVGMQNKSKPLIGITYPGSEGERTGVYGMSASNNRWALRSHPLTANYEQNYTAVFSLTKEADYVSAMKNTWQKYYQMANPPIYNVDLNTVYNDQIQLLNRYWKKINNAPGFPFRIQLDGNVPNSDYNYLMGFTGQQISNAAILIREGIISNNISLKQKGEDVAEWWANNAIHTNGAVRTWYDPYPQTWRTNMLTYNRVLGDAMQGLLWAWNYEKKSGVNKPNWLQTCMSVANWVISKQGSDGSFPRAINYVTNTIQESEKTNTSHIIPFLVELYFATNDNTYKQAATNAGNYIYNDSHINFKYVGGTPDNPNVPDKEAASMALRAYLALYDLTKEAKWLDAAKQAGYYYQTWVFAWNVPIPSDDMQAKFPKNRSTSGLSVIASAGNGSDSYAAIDAFGFYRLYLYTNDNQFLNIAKLLLRNTKQAVNWDRANPIAGYGDPGILIEAMSVTIPRGQGVNYYLPWQAYNYVEPMVLFKDVFGNMDINIIEASGNKNALHDAYSLKRFY